LRAGRLGRLRGRGAQILTTGGRERRSGHGISHGRCSLVGMVGGSGARRIRLW
jgi:hypothetical protein